MPMKTKKLRVGDIDIAYRIYGKGRALVLIMGHLGTMDMWHSTLLKMLSGHYKVIVFDNRGMGRTSSSRKKFTIKLFADDIARLLSRLRIKRSHILGWSMGSNIAIELALMHPEKVDKLILCAADCGAGKFIHPKIHTAKKQYLPQIPRDLSKKSVKRQTRAMEKWGVSYRQLKKIKCPTLFITGTRDTLIHPDNSVIMARRFPNARLVRVRGAGHGVMYQYPSTFSKTVVAFLKK